MINALFVQPGYETAKKMMDVTALRHEAIASNISNIETPNYKRIDLSPSFQSQLQQALGAGDQNQIASLTPSLSVDTTAVSQNHDGNTVTLEDELLAMSNNTLTHHLETMLVSGEMMKLRMAITGHA
ncbi:MAG TPA: flagellar basal body rod protein FlgB [Verrucomicrobiae bacterium]|nr:flagellar basal body rod protein FlgB [Verrucomicrobiae bacterium]